MRRRLIAMRHAKSSWVAGVKRDHQRPLNDEGRRQAPIMAQKLLECGWTPQQVLCSDAARTQETWSRMADAFPGTPAQLLPELYHAGFEAFSKAVRRVDADCTCVMLLGHNPGWEAVVDRLTGVAVRMGTADAALMEAEGADWDEALHHDWKLVAVLRP